MTTFRIRFKFYISGKGKLTGDGKGFSFSLPNGHSANIKCLESDSFCESKQFAITSGGYHSEVEALDNAKELKEAVLCYSTKYGLGLNPGKDNASCHFPEHLKNEFFRKHGVEVIDDVHGIMVHSEEHPVSYTSASASGIVNSKNREFFIDEVCNILKRSRKMNDKIRLSMELFNASFFETSSRSRFLTLILAAEAILDPDDRSKETKKLVNDLRELIQSYDIKDYEKDSMLGAVNRLKKDSISQSLSKMASKYLSGEYSGLSSEEFIKKCYNARSKLVHDGDVNESKYNIGSLAATLEVYMNDLLVEMSQI